MRQLASTAAILFGLLLLVLPTWLVRGSRDIDRVHDAELRGWQRSVRDAERNAWNHLEQALHESVFEEDDNEFRRWVVGRYHDAAPLRAFLERNAEALGDLERALREPHFELPRRSREGERPTAPSERLGEMLRVRALVHLEDGDPERALADALDAVRLGGKLESARGADVADGMLGVAVRAGGLQTLRTVAARSQISAERARQLAAELEAERSDPEAWKKIWAEAYQSLVKRLEPRLAASDHQAGEPQLLPLLPRGYQYHPKRTRQQLADIYQVLQRDSAVPCAELSRPDPRRDEADAVARLLKPNRAGEVLVELVAPDHRRLFERRCLAETALSATQAILALRAYELEHGSLPARLDELVPRYLDAVPRDGFDGAPLRYAPAARWLYSVGSDFLDSGGLRPSQPPKLVEPTFGIESF